MNKTLKIIIIVAACVIIAAAAVGLVIHFAFSKTEQPPEQTTGSETENVETVEIELASKVLELDIYDTATIEVEGEFEEELKWSSSDEKIASVDEGGVVTALSVGTCEITVTTSNGKGTCIVTVSNSYIAPTLILSNYDVEILVGGDYLICPTLKYKGVDYSDNITFEYHLADGSAEDVLSMTETENGCLIKGLKEGIASYIVYAEYADVQLSKRIDFTVKNVDVFFSASNLTPTENGYILNLDTLTKDKITPDVSVIKGTQKQDDAKITYVSADPNVVAVLDDGTLTAVSAGQTTVTGTYETYSFTFAVTVVKFEKEIEILNTAPIEIGRLSNIELDEEPQGVFVNAMIGDVSVGESLNGSNLTLSKEKLEKLSASSLGENVQLSIETDKAIYHTTLDIYTLIIKTEEDYYAFGELSKAACADSPLLFGGYFILGNNITVTNGMNEFIDRSKGSFTSDGTTGFCGIFDGQGFVIDGLAKNTNSGNSFITAMHSDGVLKNIGFTNAVFSGNEGSFLVHMGRGTVEDVYISYSEISNSNNNYSATLIGGGGPLTVNRVFIDATNAVVTGDGKYFHLMTANNSNIANLGDNTCIVVVPSDYTNPSSAEGDESIQVDSSGAQIHDRAYISYETLKASSVFERMQGWDANIWSVDIETGKVIFKNAIEDQ